MNESINQPWINEWVVPVVCNFHQQQRGKSLPSRTQDTQILSVAAVTCESSGQWQWPCLWNTEGPHLWEDPHPKVETFGDLSPWTPLPILDATAEGPAFSGEGGERRAVCRVFTPLISWERSPAWVPGNSNQQPFAGRGVWLYRRCWASWVHRPATGEKRLRQHVCPLEKPHHSFY